MTASAHPGGVEAIYAAFAERLQRFVAGRVHDRVVAEDIVQDVFVTLAEAGVDDIDNTSAWLYAVARNAVIDHYRSASRRREVPTDVARLPEVPTDSDEDHAIWDEIVACLEPFLDGLTPKHREALSLTDLGSMTQAEAAAAVGISAAGMKSRVQRARREVLHDLKECCTITLDGRGRPIEWAARSATPASE